MTFDLEIAAEMSQRIGDATKRSKGGKDANAMVARRGQRRAQLAESMNESDSNEDSIVSWLRGE